MKQRKSEAITRRIEIEFALDQRDLVQCLRMFHPELPADLVYRVFVENLVIDEETPVNITV